MDNQTVQPVTQAQPPIVNQPISNQPEPKKSVLVRVLIVIIIILLIVAVGLGIYIWQHNKVTSLQKQLNAANTSSKTSAVSSTKTSNSTTASPYAGWKSFCSTAGGGLCLKYPSNWTFKQSTSQSVVPESDVLTSPSGAVAVDYLPGEGLGSDATGTVVETGATSSTQASDLSTYSAVVQSSQGSSFTGYDAELFVGETSNETDSVGSQLPTPPEFSSQELFSGQETNVLDVVQSNTNSTLANAQANFSTEAEAQTWLNSSEVKTAQLILESASYKL